MWSFQKVTGVSTSCRPSDQNQVMEHKQEKKKGSGAFLIFWRIQAVSPRMTGITSQLSRRVAGHWGVFTVGVNHQRTRTRSSKGARACQGSLCSCRAPVQMFGEREEVERQILVYWKAPRSGLRVQQHQQCDTEQKNLVRRWRETFSRRSSWSPGGDFWMWAVKIKRERGRLERFALRMTLFMQKIHSLNINWWWWGRKKTVSKGWLVGWPTTGCSRMASSSISGEVEKTKRTLIQTRGVRSPSQPAVTPQMEQACISAAAAVVAVAAVVSSVSESVEPPWLRPVCSALLHPVQPQQKCLQPLCPPGAPVWGRQGVKRR